MNILMLTPYLPYPPASGGQIRTLNLLRYLSKNNDITLVSLYKNAQEKQYAKHLESFCKEIHLCKRAEKPWQIKNIIKSVCSLNPFLVVRNYSTEAKEVIGRLLQDHEFDVIHAETFYIMPHIGKTDVPILLVEQTIEYKVYQHFISTLPWLLKMVLSLDIMKLKRGERHYWHQADLVAAVSQYDKEIIKSIAPSIDPVIIPNGAGDEMFVKELPDKLFDKPKILFLGNFSWLQNVEAAEYLIQQVQPTLYGNNNNIELIIAGQNTEGKIQADTKHNVTIIDIDPSDGETVKRLYREATIFVAPIFGPGGTRLKILAAMAAGLPVVSTKVGLEGLNIQHETHALTAQSPQEFARQITSLLKNKDLYKKIQKNAHAHVLDGYSWQNISQQLEAAYEKMKG